MRVLHFASWYPNEMHPQLGNFVQRQIRAVADETSSVVLHAWPGVSGDLNKDSWTFGNGLEQDLREALVPVRNLPPRRWRTERAYNRVCECMDKAGQQPDLIHLHIAADAASSAVQWADRWEVPLVVSEHWTAYHAENKRSFRSKEEAGVRAALRAASLHLPVSSHLGRAMTRFAPGVNQQVIPNVVESCFSLPQKPRAIDGSLRLLHVSSLLDDHKNIKGMLRALADAATRGADFVVQVIGGAGAGKLEIPGFENLVGQLGLQERIEFTGPASPFEVAAAMQRSDALVLFSRYENLPCVLLEAWSTGLPVMATNVGGVGEHLEGRPMLGTLIPNEDEKALSDAILAFDQRKKSGELTHEKETADYASARFTTSAVGERILQAYRSVLR